MQDKLGLGKGILHPRSSDVGRTIVEYRVTLEMLEMLAQRRPAFVCSNIALEGDASWDRLDWGEIDTDNEGVRGHNLGSLVRRRMVLSTAKYL